MGRKLVMDIRIVANGPALHMKAEDAEVDMIPFRGEVVKSDFFTGVVEPCGVDTQILNAANVRHMSARYMLTGADGDGRDCHIYVDNEGWFEGPGLAMPFRTVPVFRTDSPALAAYLHRSRFIGEGDVREDGLHICFYEIDGDEA